MIKLYSKRKAKVVFLILGWMISWSHVNAQTTPTITTLDVASGVYRQGVEIRIPYAYTGTFGTGNVFSAQLSDATGSFASPIDLGSLETMEGGLVEGGTIRSFIPNSIMPGTGYRVRVISSNPGVIGTPNQFDITIERSIRSCQAYALNFDGSNDFVSTSTNLLPNYTIETWVKVDDANNRSLIVGTNNSGPSSSWSHQLRVSNGKFEHYLWDGSAHIVTGSTNVVPGTWYHVAITASQGGRMNLFVNGVQEGGSPSIGTAWTGLNQFRFGSNGGGYGYMDGQLEEVRIWSTALTPSTINQWKNKTITSTHPSYSNLTGYYIMDEGNGNTTVNEIDFSKNGTLTGMDASSWVASASPLSCNGMSTAWTGAFSSSWQDPDNWTNGVPNETKDVTIPAGTPRNIKFPEVTYNFDYKTKNLTIDKDAVLNMESVINLYGNFTNNGTFTSYNGNGLYRVHIWRPITIAGSSTTSFGQLSIEPNATTTVNANISIYSEVWLKSDMNIANSKTMTLLSEGPFMAVVDNIGDAEVNGTVIVQRKIGAHFGETYNTGRGYRHFSSPVVSTTVADLTTSGFTPILNTAYNVLPTPPANSFTTANFPNVFEYDESRLNATYNTFTTGWKVPASTSSTLVPGRGYSVNIPATSKVDLRGTLNNGEVNVALTRGPVAESGWHLLGNPYPSPLSINNLGTAVYVYRSSGRYTGSYDSYVNGVGNGTGYVGVMQGFFIRASEAMTYTFNNSMRYPASYGIHFYRKGREVRPLVELSLTSPDGKADNTFFYFEEGATTGAEEKYDAWKLMEGEEGQPALYSFAGNETLSINGQSELTSERTIQLGVNTYQAGPHTFRVEQLLNFESGYKVFLEDRVTGEMQDLKQNPSYTFTPTPNDKNRFAVHFGEVKPLGIEEISIEGNLVVYPNPVDGDVLQVSLGNSTSKNVNAALRTSLGQLIFEQKLTAKGNGASGTFNTASLRSGIYFLTVTDGNTTATRKVIVK